MTAVHIPLGLRDIVLKILCLSLKQTKCARKFTPRSLPAPCPFSSFQPNTNERWDIILPVPLVGQLGSTGFIMILEFSSVDLALVIFSGNRLDKRHTILADFSSASHFPAFLPVLPSRCSKPYFCVYFRGTHPETGPRNTSAYKPY